MQSFLAMPRSAWGCLGMATLLAGFYLIRAVTQVIPPEDHVEYLTAKGDTDMQLARLVLVTSLGMIPVNEHFQENPTRMDSACQHINSFLHSQRQYLAA